MSSKSRSNLVETADARKASDKVEVKAFAKRVVDSENGDQSKKQHVIDYASVDYWNERYEKGEDIEKSFEWFVRYSDIEPILRSTVNYKDRTAICVDLGCGTSMFLRDLKNAGYKGPCLGLDYSKGAIDVMKTRKDCLNVDFRVCDATEFHHTVKGASLIVDKSLIDTVMHCEDETIVSKVLRAIAKCVKADGHFVSVTQLDPRKPKDLAFLKDVVLKNLCSGSHFVNSVTAHVTATPATETPVPSVIVYNFGSAARNIVENVEVDVIEYENSESDDVDDS